MKCQQIQGLRSAWEDAHGHICEAILGVREVVSELLTAAKRLAQQLLEELQVTEVAVHCCPLRGPLDGVVAVIALQQTLTCLSALPSSEMHGMPANLAPAFEASLALILQILQLLESERGKMEDVHQEFRRYRTIGTILPAASAGVDNLDLSTV
eukprot:Skav206495  [mRNA]  locus=scaffold1128:166325:167853:+ [translate_table: standard]